MIIITGGVGFIGYNLILKLNELGHKNIVVVDNNYKKSANMGFLNVKYMNVEDSYLWLPFNKYDIDFIFHLGARTDTMEKDEKIFKRLNLDYSKFIWELCAEAKIPLIYASSAAVYGNGYSGFFEDIEPEGLNPLNEYGWSKLNFDAWMLDNDNKPPFWAALRFFNVYGNHEQHKGKMASVIWHLYNQIKETGKAKLFRSHLEWCDDGEQQRDFIHVNDVVNTMIWIANFKEKVPSSIYNLGTGSARTYNDLAKAIFKSLGKEENISYIDIPIEIRDSYQYYTRAETDNLFNILGGCKFLNLEQGIDLYIKELENEIS